MWSRRSSGSAALALPSRQAPSPLAGGGWDAGSVVSAGASPQARPCSATTAPSPPGTATLVAQSPTTVSRPAHSGDVGYRCLPSTRTLPFSSARAPLHPAHSSGRAGSAGIAARSSSNGSGPGRPFP